MHMTRHWRCLESNFTVDDSGLPIWWKFTFPQGGEEWTQTMAIGKVGEVGQEAQTCTQAAAGRWMPFSEASIGHVMVSESRNGLTSHTCNPAGWHESGGVGCPVARRPSVSTVPPLLPCCSPLSYHWIPLPPLAASFRIIIKCMGCFENTSEDGAAGHQQMNLELLVQQQRGIQARLSTCLWSVHPWDGTLRNKSPRPLLVISGDWALDLVSMQETEEWIWLCVSDSKERIRNLEGPGLEPEKAKTTSCEGRQGVMRRANHTGLQAEQLWQAS